MARATLWASWSAVEGCEYCSRLILTSWPTLGPDEGLAQVRLCLRERGCLTEVFSFIVVYERDADARRVAFDFACLR